MKTIDVFAPDAQRGGGLGVMARKTRKVLETHQFTLILTGIKDLTPDVTDALYEAGFGDALVGMAAGVPYIDVNHRQAESLEKAVRAAIRDVGADQ